MQCKTFSFQFLRTFEELRLHNSYNTTNSMKISALKKKKHKPKTKTCVLTLTYTFYKNNLEVIITAFDNLRT